MTDGNGWRHDLAIEALLSGEGFQSFQLAASLRTLVETGAEGLEAARCSVWQFSSQPRTLSCISLYDEASGGHVPGPVLLEAEHPELFARLSLPQPQCYGRGDADLPLELAQFMAAHGFSALMQWPVVVQGQFTAVLAFADRTPNRAWSDEDQSFAKLLAALAALAFRGDELRRQAFPCAVSPVNVAPVNIASAYAAVNAVQDLAFPTDASSSTILLVDADTAVHELLGEALSRGAYHLIHAFDHEQGFDLAAEIVPDVIVVNVLSPGLDGWGLLGRLKTHENLRRIPVVVLTLSGEEDEGYLLRASDFLTKPFRFEALLEAVNHHRPAVGQPRLLVVEDEDVTRSVLSRLLERDGWLVACAANGFEGLKALEASRPDLILLDLMMPGMDGFEFIRMLRTTEHPGQHLPLVVVTAKDLSDEERNWLTGTTRSLAEQDAVSRAELVDTIRDWVGHATARRTVVC
ncbi:MAG TPA: response regulator [Candidatus Sulfotelmatobacter sp.]|nr:response regulator [Candidatus Sulfotelmatobacter sp.]